MKGLLYCIGIALSGCATISTTATTGEAGKPSGRTYIANAKAVHAEALIALSALNWEVITSDSDAGVIIAKTPVSLTTYGDKVTVRFTEAQAGQTRVTATSSTGQAFDWGKGGRNLKDLFGKLDAVLEQVGAAEAAALQAQKIKAAAQARAEAEAAIDVQCQKDWSGNAKMIAQCQKDQRAKLQAATE